MLTKLPNGSAVDLSKAVTIQAAEASDQFPEIKPRVIIKWFHESSLGRRDSFHECQIVNYDTFEQACQERDRLIEIANRQSSKTVVVNNTRFRSGDVISVSIVDSYVSPFTKRLAYVNVRKVDGSGTVPHGTLFETPEKAHEYAREIMEQVAGSQE